MAIDYGDARIGLAVSDETRTSVRPLKVLKNNSRHKTAEEIAKLAADLDIDQVVIGMSYDDEGQPTPFGRKVLRFAEIFAGLTTATICYQDEFATSIDAVSSGVAGGLPRQKRAISLDARAAAHILSAYLEEHQHDSA